MRTVFTILLCIGLLPASAQKQKKTNESFYLFDRNWNPTSTIDSAAYLGYVRKINDTTHQWFNYKFSGPLISVETYKDEDYSIPNGFMAYYDEWGLIDSSGYAKNGKRDRTWYFYTDTLSVAVEKDYDNGILVNTIDLVAKKQQETEDIDSRHGSDAVENEAGFKGGIGSWQKYLQKNIRMPDRAVNLNKSGKVMIQFIIDTDGSLKDLVIVQSVEFSLDKEAWRLIEGAPKWEPAIQNGKYVKAYRRQPITFAVQ